MSASANRPRQKLIVVMQMCRFFLMKNRSVAALREDFEEEKAAQMRCYN